MLKSAVGKVMWVGRATVFLVGLAVILGLVFGAASVALGANGKPFLLGRENVASQVSRLVKHGPGPALKLTVQDGQAPMAVSSSGKVADLNADQLDGQDAEDLKPLLADVQGDGTLDTAFSNTRGVVSVGKLGTGIYEVTFDRDVSNCVRLGTAGLTLNGAAFPDPDFIRLQQYDGQVSTFNSTRGDDKIGVITDSPNGTGADRGFQLAVYC